jgi:ring-1,2-phenylacetyl-CoA epoxidase subunit PaaD
MTATPVVVVSRSRATPWNALDAVAAGLPIQIAAAISSVSDPEYPGISIVDLGLVVGAEHDADTDAVAVQLIPTFSGCPALGYIADDVRVAVEAVAARCDVTWLGAPAWSTERISDVGRRALADEFTVVVERPGAVLTCPVCGGTNVDEQSPAGPTRCRSIAWCSDCRNPVEVMR